MSILLRLVLLLVLAMLVVRAIRRMLAGLVDGITRPPGRTSGPPDRGVQMVRDPVCGTFLPPEHALTLTERGEIRYFCSEKCRDAYRAGEARLGPPSSRPRG